MKRKHNNHQSVTFKDLKQPLILPALRLSNIFSAIFYVPRFYPLWHHGDRTVLLYFDSICSQCVCFIIFMSVSVKTVFIINKTTTNKATTYIEAPVFLSQMILSSFRYSCSALPVTCSERDIFISAAEKTWDWIQPGLQGKSTCAYTQTTAFKHFKQTPSPRWWQVDNINLKAVWESSGVLHRMIKMQCPAERIVILKNLNTLPIDGPLREEQCEQIHKKTNRTVISLLNLLQCRTTPQGSVGCGGNQFKGQHSKGTIYIFVHYKYIFIYIYIYTPVTALEIR